MNCKNLLTKILIIMMVLLSCEARGGRRGGSLGGFFGGWRKYKKPVSGGASSRRIVSSSPVHTPITKAWHDNKKSTDSFQKKNMFHGYNTPPLPTGGSFYHSTAALPGNAIYVAQAPPRGAEFGDFLTGYLTGRLLTMGYPSSHYHVTHVYRENAAAAENNNISQAVVANGQNELHNEKLYSAPLYELTTIAENFNITHPTSVTTEIPSSTTKPSAAPYGVICIPMSVDETNSNGEKIQTERTVCYPAPAPVIPQEHIKSKPVEIAGDITEH